MAASAALGTAEPKLTDRWQQIQGVTSHYVVGGEGPPTLLLHGWGADISAWGRVIRGFLAEGRRVLAVDFPGFGQSARPPEPWGVADYTSWLRQVIDATGLLPADIVAHSFGGRVAIMLAATQPQYVRKLALTSAAGIRLDSPRSKLRAQVVRRAIRLGRLAFRLPGLDGLRDRVREKVYTRLGATDYLNAGALRPTFVKVVSQDLREYAGRITAPTLLLWGERDMDTPLAQAAILHAAIAGSRLVVLKGAGHFSYLERYPEWSAHVNRFLNE